MSGRRTVAELLRALAAVMAERGQSWYLFGAQAAIIWGSPRLSADVDITATIEPSAIGAFVETMRRHDFDLLVGDADFVSRTRSKNRSGTTTPRAATTCAVGAKCTDGRGRTQSRSFLAVQAAVQPGEQP